MTDGTVDEQVLIFRHQFQPRVIILDSTLVISQILTGHATHLIGIDDKRIALNGQPGILLSATIILQADFCHRTVEIGFGEKGLSLDGLVKVLDGKDIILEVERITPDVYHLVGVDLGKRRQCRSREDQQHCQSTIYGRYLFHNCINNGKSSLKFRDHQKSLSQHYIFHISSHYFLKEAKGFGGEGKRC